jgi:hypothetical protein
MKTVLSAAAMLASICAAHAAPPLPGLPPQVESVAYPYNLYVGGAGDGTASAPAASADAAAPQPLRSDTPFDYSSYCYQPGSNGLPRTPAWTANCLSSNARAYGR